LTKVGFNLLFDARPLKSAIQPRIENALSKPLLEGRFPPKSVILVSVDPVRDRGVFHFDVAAKNGQQVHHIGRGLRLKRY